MTKINIGGSSSSGNNDNSKATAALTKGLQLERAVVMNKIQSCGGEPAPHENQMREIHIRELRISFIFTHLDDNSHSKSYRY